jgi:hypothetical protein
LSRGVEGRACNARRIGGINFSFDIRDVKVQRSQCLDSPPGEGKPSEEIKQKCLEKETASLKISIIPAEEKAKKKKKKAIVA